MRRLHGLAMAGLLASASALLAAPEKPKTMADVLAASTPSDWRPLDPESTLYLELAIGRIVIELAPLFAPQHAANIKALVREHYFDGLAIVRVQDNYVVQWADPDSNRPIRTAKRTLPAEFTIPLRSDIHFTRLPDADGYAPQVGFSGGFYSARDPKAGTAWLAHCYGMVGAGRDNDIDSGGGTELYVVIGNAPRHLDRNITLVGRVVQGIELLSSLPRGTAQLGYYEKPEQRVPIKSMQVAADVPEPQRSALEVIRTDTQTFKDLVEARRNRRDDWYKIPAGYVELCNVPIVVRPRPAH
jgi:cyclophilin family peptidyl-prolyl cis-trans isomerase